MEEDIIAQRIQDIRTEKHLSQAQFAKICNVRQSCVSKWERGNTYPSLEMIIFICTTFKVSSDYLLGLKDY